MVLGLKQSKAASNPDGGVKDLLAFLERKATGIEAAAGTDAVRIRKVCGLSVRFAAHPTPLRNRRHVRFQFVSRRPLSNPTSTTTGQHVTRYKSLEWFDDSQGCPLCLADIR